jgi:sugar lactone lactonase YvrE
MPATPPAPTLHVIPVPGTGAEDVVVSPDGTVWTGTEDGAVIGVDPRTGRAWVAARTGGRPLGLELLDDGRLLVCDALRGLLAVDTGSGVVEVLVADVAGVPMRFCNNAAVETDGTIWFTDTSDRFGVFEWKSDLIEHTRSGRLLRRRPDGEVTVLLGGLAFANGVALPSDDSCVLVAETALRRVRRLWLTGARAGEVDTFVEDLPGYPDNIARGSDGLIWVTYASPTDPVLGLIQRAPGPLRTLVRIAPEAVKPAPQRTARVAAYDPEGRLVQDLDLDPSDWHMATGVREHEGRVWLGSLVEPAVAYVDL